MDQGFTGKRGVAHSIAGMDAVRLHRLGWHPGAAGTAVIEDVDLAVPPGRVLTLLGPSGAGKTTLLRLVAGLQAPSAGRVEIGGEDVTAHPAAQRPVGLVAQHPALFPDLSVLDNVAFRLRLQPRLAADAAARARDALGLLGIAGLAARRSGELSEGEQQRVALARALAAGPAVLLLDEPLAHLDHGLRRALREEIRALQSRLGLTLVWVTHDHAEAMAVSDHIALLDRGRIVQQGSPRSLYEQPATAFVAAFMGEMRLFEGWSDGHGALRLGLLELPAAAAAPAGPVRLVVRPEAWRIGPAHGPGLAARVLRSACTGSRVEYGLASELGELLAWTPRTPRRHEAGAPISLTLADHGVSVLPPGP